MRVTRGVPVAQTIAQRHLIVSSEHDSARVPVRRFLPPGAAGTTV
jgi:hypothetical protein